MPYIWKDIRIFISSTFNDMHAERDYLVKYVFPELVEWCEKRRLRMVDIDLRWGVTKEESESNNTLRKCLENIEECRPFFLCLLGQRRGWIPNDPLRMAYKGKSLPKDSEISEETTDEYPEVISKEYEGRFSVTEMEIEHALLHPMYRVLQNIHEPSGQKCNAVFFERVNNWQPKNFSDVHKRIYTNADVCEWGGDPALADAAMEETKRKINEHQPIIRYTCHWDDTMETPELSAEIHGDILRKGRLTDFQVNGDSFKDAVLEELKKVILYEFPERNNPCITNGDKYVLDREQQDLFVQTASEGYAQRSDLENNLKDYLQDETQKTMLITAEAGLGKTTLLAHFVRNASSGFDPAHGVFRFCGVSDLTNDSFTLWNSICRQTQVSPPESMDDLRQNMPQILNQIAEAGFHYIIIDAVNQMQDGERMLQIIPPELPRGLKLILSIKQDKGNPDSLITMQERFILFPITGLDNDKVKNNLIDFFLKRYLKTLDKDQKDALCASKQSKNPLFLKIILHELHFFGAYKQLPAEIAKYKESPLHAFNQVLIRLETEQAEEGILPGQSVSFLFGLLACARNGLTEKELFLCFSRRFKQHDPINKKSNHERILGTIRYYLRQVRPFMARRNGRIDFLYDSFKEAAFFRYTDSHKELHKTLGDCFQKLCDPDGDDTFDSDNTRAFVELGYHVTEYDYYKGEQLYSKLTYLDARCSLSSIQLLLTEMNRFQTDICRSFHKIILRFQSVLSNYPNALFSICRAEKSSPPYRQTDKLIADEKWSKTWLDVEQIFTLQDTEHDEQCSLRTLKLTAMSEPFVFNEGCAFSPAADLFIFSETLGQLRAFDTNTFDLLPCIIYTQPIRVISIKISSNGKYLAVAHENAVIELFKLEYSPEGVLQHATSMKQDITSLRPKRGYSSYDFSDNCLCYQSNENTIRVFDLSASLYTDLVQTEHPIVLDAIVSLKDTILFSVRQGMYSLILCYSQSDKAASVVKTLEGVFTRRSCILNAEHFCFALSDNRVIILDTSGNMMAERKMDSVVKSIGDIENKLLILCQPDKCILWDWPENCIKPVDVEKNSGQHLNQMVFKSNLIVLAVLDASIAKYELKDGCYETHHTKKKIISLNETPELTVAVFDSNSNCIRIQQADFCSAPIYPEDNTHYSVCLTGNGSYLLSEYGHGYYMPPDQSQFRPLKEIGQAVRILKSWPAPDGCVYYIDTLWNFCCGQSNFTYELSGYQFNIIEFYAFGQLVLLFGTASGVQATSNVSTGHEPLTGTLLIFETICPGFLRFYGERLFSAKYGVPVDATFHPDTDLNYMLFNTPHSGKSKDLLHVCFGKKDELIGGKENHSDINICRRERANPSTACVSDSYLVCYQGSIFSYDATTLTYQSAIAISGSFGKLQASQANHQYALALSNHSTEIKHVTIKQGKRRKPND